MVTCGSVRQLAATYGGLLSLTETRANAWRLVATYASVGPFGVTCGSVRQLAATYGSLRSRMLTCGKLW